MLEINPSSFNLFRYLSPHSSAESQTIFFITEKSGLPSINLLSTTNLNFSIASFTSGSAQYCFL